MQRPEGGTARPFEIGAGLIDVAAATDAGFTIDETPAAFAAARDARRGLDLNLPSVGGPLLPGRVVTHRTLRSTSDRPTVYAVATEATAAGSACPPSRSPCRPAGRPA